MSLRKRSGNWHYRFFAAGRSWTADTGLVATERNRNAALMAEAEARRLVGEGRPDQLKIQVKPFSDAADQFIEWAKGEHREHKETWKRLRVSMASLKVFFKLRPLHTIGEGPVQDYMSWRRLCPECSGEGCDLCDQTGQGVKEITLRHDLHALSPLFTYGINHNWCAANPVERVKIPSDAEAVRIHVLSAGEEMLYFETCKRLAAERRAEAAHAKGGAVWAKQRAAQCFDNLHDIGRLMLLQGPRPSEVKSTRTEHVDVARAEWRIAAGKSRAAGRVLDLTPESRGILEQRSMSAGADGFLFRGRKPGTALSGVENAHQRVLKASGLAFVIYDFRHTFATRFAEATGGDVVALAAILGHANLRTVMRYVHVSREHRRTQMRRFVEVEEIRASQIRVKSGSNGSAEMGKSEQTSANEAPLGNHTIQ
jgi:integrase